MLSASAADEAPQVRKAAALGLSRSGTPEAVAKLREIAENDPADWVRAFAAARM